jgi:hypothetical protein
VKSQSEKSEETRGLGVKKDRGGPAGPKKSVFFVGRALFVGEAPLWGRPKKRARPKTQKPQKKPNIFFWVNGQKEEYVIRKRGTECTLLLQSQAHKCVCEEEEDEEDVDGVG